MACRTNRWAIGLLPFLVARLFVPTGFMLSTSGAGVGIALCPGYAPLPESADAAATVHHHTGMDPAPDGGAHSEHEGSGPSKCPFVLVGSTAGCPPILLAGDLSRPLDAVPAFHPHPDWASPAVLIDRIRGPPHA